MAGSRESSRTTFEPPGSYELPWPLALVLRRDKPGQFILTGGSDVLELSLEPPMFLRMSEKGS